MLGIIDYGMGNLASVKNACDALGVKSVITSDVATLEQCQRLILPGVGAFKDSMANIHASGLYEPIQKMVKEEKKPLLGICLGMQVLFEMGYEDGLTQGFGFLKGTIQKMEGKDLRIPQIGWNQLEKSQDHLIFKNLNRPFVYYVHSYMACDVQAEDLLGYSNYGTLKVPGLVAHGNVMGAQFHPEKSGKDGLEILRYFVEEFV